jgi:enoyl-CoA hydratase
MLCYDPDVMELVTYEGSDGVATIAMDDGKVNCLSPRMLGELNEALDRAESDRATVLLTGREGRFSAGFDLAVVRAGGEQARLMFRAGFELAQRLLSFPTPVVVGCTGHAVAMGAFLLLSADVRIGAEGPFRITANEVAIGLTMPRAAVVLCRQRLTPAAFNRAVIVAEVHSPETAVTAGFLDRMVPAGEVGRAARETAVAVSGLDMAAHAATKLRARADVLDALRAGIEADDAVMLARAG